MEFKSLNDILNKPPVYYIPMKIVTIRDLPEPIKQKAIKYRLKNRGWTVLDKHNAGLVLDVGLDGCFEFKNTTEGHEYWNNIFKGNFPKPDYIESLYLLGSVLYLSSSPNSYFLVKVNQQYIFKEFTGGGAWEYTDTWIQQIKQAIKYKALDKIEIIEIESLKLDQQQIIHEHYENIRTA